MTLGSFHLKRMRGNLDIVANSEREWPTGILAATLDNLPAMVALWDADQRNVYANPAYAGWLDRTPAEIRGKHGQDVIDPALYALQLPFIRAALEGQCQSFQRTATNPHGETRHAQVHYRPHVVDGVVAGYFVHIADITDRVNAEYAVREQAGNLALLQERERISDAVHSVVIQQLYAAALELAAAKRDATADQAIRLQAALDGIDKAIVELRTSVHARA